MSKIKCVVRRMTDGFDVPDDFIDMLPNIPKIFAESSGNAIDLQMDNQITKDVISPHKETSSALDLHLATSNLTGNKQGERVNTITLLLANRYEFNEDVFGLMFDRGFDTDDDPNDDSEFTGIPREGCVVFVGAISTHRTKEPEHFVEELFFTAVHELGHIFNLPHKFAEANYMATSPKTKPHDLGFFQFIDDQKRHLARANTDKFVFPGGSKFIGSSSNNLIEQNNLAKIGLSLEIGLPYREFTSLTPVELDIQLSVGLGINKRFRVANCIDPGYDEFNIWITDPDNERRRYRSPRIYCQNGGSISIRPGKPFQRDISLFFQAGGQTFYKSGVHHIQAEFNLGRRGILKSNKLAINILPDRAEGSEKRIALLRDKQVCKLLYHREIDKNDSVIDRIESHLATEKGGISAASLHYAVASSMNKITKKKELGKLDLVHKHIKLAFKCKSGLSQCQKGHADKMIQTS